MFKKVFKRIRINFRETKSERSATQSYRNYNQRIRKIFQKANVFTKLSKKFKGDERERKF